MVTPFKGIQAPNNDVVMGGEEPLEYLTAEGATIKPGHHVKKGSTDDLITPGDASGNSIGWAGYGKAGVFKPTDTTTAYAAGDLVPVHEKPGLPVKAWLASGETVVKGQPLKPAANGELAAATVGTDDIIARAAEDASGNVQFMIKSMI
ncbi:hypothetical protein [Methanosarcina acetivorans]|nr:hypothetical protein [Methanosarcina acetivorans]